MKPAFATEAEMCAAFIAAADKGWTAFAETAGWDILLVRRADGFQIGIQAKLRLNAAVLVQAIEGHYDVTRPGPDCRAVLVPRGAGTELAALSAYIGITVISMYGPRPKGVTGPTFDPYLPKLPEQPWDQDWFELLPAQRCELPEYVPDVVAGAPAPLQLTKWKIGAIKIAVLLASRPVSRSDFKHIGIDHRRWIAAEQRWLRATPEGWRPGPRLPDFRAQHPRVWEEIVADRARWEPKPPVPLPQAAPQQLDFGSAAA